MYESREEKLQGRRAIISEELSKSAFDSLVSRDITLDSDYKPAKRTD